MYDNPNEETYATLPNWRLIPDPEIEGSSIWVHDDYDGNPDRAILVTGEINGGEAHEITVLAHPLITPSEVWGECLGTFPTWDDAWDFALASLED